MAETSKKSKERTEKSKQQMAYIKENFRQKMGWSKEVYYGRQR